MFIFNSRHPGGYETGVGNFPDRLCFATTEQNLAIANQRMAVERHEREILGNASPLPRDVWGEWDREAIQVQRDVLAVFGDLAAAVPFSLPIGKIVHNFLQVSDSGEVHVSIDGRSNGLADQPVYAYQGTPVPIIDSPFSFTWRQVEAASTEGVSLDGAARLNANRKVAEALENIALVGNSKIVVDGKPLYGLTNHPKRNTRATTNTLNGATGAQWLADITATLKLLHADNFRVPATLYVNWDDWFYATNTDFSTAYPNKTIAQRVLENGGVREVIPASKVEANNIIAVIKDRSVVQVLNGMPIVNRQKFRANPEDDYNFVVMAAQAIEIKYDAEDNCGIAHSAPA